MSHLLQADFQEFGGIKSERGVRPQAVGHCLGCEAIEAPWDDDLRFNGLHTAPAVTGMALQQLVTSSCE